MDKVRQNNIEIYNRDYRDPFIRRAFEVKDKLVIFSSLKGLLGSLASLKVLDVGFGTGDILLNCAQSGSECYGVELSDSAISNFRNPSDLPVTLVKAEATDLPFADNFFDLVICSHVLEHAQNDKRAMMEIRRVLKKGGRVVLGVPSFSNTNISENTLHYREYPLKEFKSLIEGWDLVYLGRYGSKIMQSILSWRIILSRVGRRNRMVGNSVSMAKGDSTFRALYQKFVVPFFLFLLSLDNRQPFFKNKPAEIWAVLKK